MKSLVLGALAVLLCVTASQANPGDVFTYTFDNLSTAGPINYQVDGEVTWKSVNTINMNALRARAGFPIDPTGKSCSTNATNNEMLISSLTNYAAGTTSLFPTLKSTDTRLRLSADFQANEWAGYVIGIWIDGLDDVTNSASTAEVEHVVQMGYDYQYQKYRIRVAAGLPVNTIDDVPQYRSTNNPTSVSTLMTIKTRLTLDMDLAANGGDGLCSLSVTDLVTGVTSAVPGLQNLSMHLLEQDPNHIAYGDPSKWTGWYIRNTRYQGGDTSYSTGYSVVDNLKLEVLDVPEPATLSLLGLGGLLWLRRRK